jgi:hypothetical protein
VYRNFDDLLAKASGSLGVEVPGAVPDTCISRLLFEEGEPYVGGEWASTHAAWQLELLLGFVMFAINHTSSNEWVSKALKEW